MKKINNVEAVGIYLDEIRIVSKDEEPQNFPRKDYELIVRNCETVFDEIKSHEHRTAIVFNPYKTISCSIDINRIVCDYAEEPKKKRGK